MLANINIESGPTERLRWDTEPTNEKAGKRTFKTSGLFWVCRMATCALSYMITMISVLGRLEERGKAGKKSESSLLSLRCWS